MQRSLPFDETTVSFLWLAMLVLSFALGNVVCCESLAPERQILGLISLPVGFQSSQARQASGPSGTQGERKYTHCLTGAARKSLQRLKGEEGGKLFSAPWRDPSKAWRACQSSGI